MCENWIREAQGTEFFTNINLTNGFEHYFERLKLFSIDFITDFHHCMYLHMKLD